MLALVDCNSFYCSCERVFRPDLKNRPVVVLSNNDGCAVSRTVEAKELGIKVGDPYFKFKNLCDTHGLVVFSANFSLYTNFSDRVMKTLKKLAAEVEIYSVDEAFLDITGTRPYESFGLTIKKTVEEHTAIPVGIGIGPTKVLAKAANRLVKKNKNSHGVLSLEQENDRKKYLSYLPIEDVWGIGSANSIKMKALGILTAQDLVSFKNEKQIQKIFTKVGLHIKHELMGISCFPFNKKVEPKKEIMCSRTFGGTLTSREEIKESIANYVSDAAEKMREQGSLCQEITVFVRTNPHNESPQYYISETKKLLTPTLDTMKLIQVAHEAFDKGFKEGYEYKKAGVRLSSFYHSAEIQLDLMEPQDSDQRITLMKTMDYLNAKEGHTVIKSAACGIDNYAWTMNQDFKSKRYTTSWNELPSF